MLKKANRLKSQGDFKRTLAGRRLCINDCFVVYGLVASPQASGSFSAEKKMQPRIGFIVSKKIHKKSVYRNRIKRRLRELVRTYLLTQPSDNRFAKYRTVVFIARNGSVEASFQTLRQKMERCLQIM